MSEIPSAAHGAAEHGAAEPRAGQLGLLGARRFLPLLITQITSAFADNLFRNAFVLLATYGALGTRAEAAGISPGMLASMAGACLVFPYLLFSATAGQLADRFDRARLLRTLKVAELVIMGGVGLALASGSIALSFLALFALGTQVTLTSPVRYSLLPQHLPAAELVDGNALLEGGTFLAILAGTIAGSLALAANGIVVAASILGVTALIGLVGSLYIPSAPAPMPDLKIGWNIWAETLSIMRQARKPARAWRAILGGSWFWLVGATYLSLLPQFARDVLDADSGVITLFLAAFSVGVGIGSSLCGRLLQGEISGRFVPLAALVMALTSIDLWLGNGGAVAVAASDAARIPLGTFLASLHGLRVTADLLVFAAAGGFFVVPLYAIIQADTPPERRARGLAAMNIANAAFMVGGAIVTSALLFLGASIPQLFLLAGLANLAVAAWSIRLLPHGIYKAFFRSILSFFYRVEVIGLENVPPEGTPTMIVANHVSFLDAALLASFLPGRPVFAIHTEQAALWWVKPLLSIVDALPVDPNKPMATKSLIKALKAGRRVAAFPEGRLNVSGGRLMKIYPGPAVIADRVGAQILPVRIDGAEVTPFSRLGAKLPRRWFPKIRLTILPPTRIPVPEQSRGRLRREALENGLYDVMADMMARRPLPPSLFAALLDARARWDRGTPILEDAAQNRLTYRKIILGSLVLGRRLEAVSAPSEAVGILLPNAAGTVVTFMALQAIGRVPAMLNFTAGAEGMEGACRAADVKTVLTSRRFVEIAKMEGVVAELGRYRQVLYLEDIRAGIGLGAKLAGLLALRRAGTDHAACGIGLDQPAVILFTSGSEGTPKGVVLSHRNFLANIAQIASVVDFSLGDRLLNALPVFHSFGLTGGMLLPLLSGVRHFMYPSPLHYRIVPEAAYDFGATIMFGTDTFLTGYARRAHPYDFHTLRLIFAGAERLREETRTLWSQKFGIRIMEGYGVTETAPVAAVNTPMHARPGTAGRLLPLMEARVEPVDGIERGGRLHLRGPNIMLGYFRAEAPGVLEPPPEGWHDTGDIVEIDREGFVKIVGRAKRFAKIAGEMISLVVSERIAGEAYPEIAHAVVAVADPRKGERLVLVTEGRGFARRSLSEAATRLNLPAIAVPSDILEVEKLPLLGSGKTDYPAVLKLVQSRQRPAVTAPEPATAS